MIYKKWYSWKFGKEILTGKTREKTLLYCKMGCFKAKSFLLGKLCDFRLVHVLFVWYFGTLFWDKNLLWFLAEKKKLFWTNKKFAYIIFKLADRMHSMRTTGASKNPDSCCCCCCCSFFWLFRFLVVSFRFFLFLSDFMYFLTNFFDEFFQRNFSTNFFDEF